MKGLPPLLALLLCGGAAFAATPVEIPNPGFEDGLAGWDAPGDAKMSQAAPEAAHEGKLGLRVTDASATTGSSLFGPKFKVAPGKTYQIRFWARAVSGSGVGVYLAFFSVDGKSFLASKELETQYDLGPLTIPGGQSEWKEFLVRKTAPPDAAEARIWIHSYLSAEAVADFDDFSVAEVGP